MIHVMVTNTNLFRSGKSSISSVVFHKMPPNETLFLESTARIQKDSMQ
jgi:Ras-related GTP-binding protein C/D